MTGDEVLQFMGLLIFVVPPFFFYFLVISLATVRRSFGVTKFYIRILLAAFEWGKQRVRLYEEQHDRSSLVAGKPIRLEKEEEEEETNQEADVTEDVKKTYEGGPTIDNKRSLRDMEHGFNLTDSMFFCKRGMEVIIEDTVTQRFDAEELSSWNLLTRTNTFYEFISWRLTFLWIIGCILRLFILFPFRLGLMIVGIGTLVVGTGIIGYFPDGRVKRRANYWLTLTCYRILSRAFSSVITFHNRENRAKGGGICVANHTSPIDIMILGCDNCYAMIGQEQGGFMGFLQRAMLRSEHHIWFQRTEAKDRLAVTRRIQEHIEDESKLPVLIFPEGTCINNTSIMMFKKGSFEVGGTIYPVAIKYDPRFADPFWNSSVQTLLRHLLNILTSWALVCDVWYLPPQRQKPDEDAAQFAKRVKSEIARQGGLVDLDWDGQLKREKPKLSFLLKQQEEYSRRIM